MATDISDRVQEIARYRGTDESAVIEQALERGLDDIWRDIVVARYLEGDIEREHAIEEVGAEVIERADAASEAVAEDIDWALGENSA